MAVTIWTWEPDYPIDIEREYDETVIPLGPGHEVIVSRDVAHTRATGYGSSAAYTGRNIFRCRFGRLNYNGTTEFKPVLTFIQARKADGAAFYFYNVLENCVPATWTGDASSSGTDPAGNAVTNATGRYLVRIYGNVNWQLAQKKLVALEVEFREVWA